MLTETSSTENHDLRILTKNMKQDNIKRCKK